MSLETKTKQKNARNKTNLCMEFGCLTISLRYMSYIFKEKKYVRIFLLSI